MLLVSQHTFRPSCVLKKKKKEKTGDDAALTYKQANNADIHTRLLLNEGAVQEKTEMTAMCKEKATCLRLRVKAEVMQTRDDPSDVSKITDVSNLTAPPI